MKIFEEEKKFTTFNNKVTLCKLTLGVKIEDYVTLYASANGRSKCHEDDQFDQHIGNEIAFQRARKRALEKLLKDMQTDIEYEKYLISLLENGSKKLKKEIERKRKNIW